MVTVIDITEHLAQFQACDLIVVDGEACCESCVGSCACAPELWRKLTDPCPTCNGLGHLPAVRYRVAARPCPSPDCVGGRQVVTLTAACPRCSFNESYRADWLPIWLAKHDTDGRVTLGRFTIVLLPVVEHFGKLANSDPCVCVGPTGVFLHGPRKSPRRLALDPLPQPGQWAVQFEAVSA